MRPPVPDIIPDIPKVPDGGETIGLMEPLLIVGTGERQARRIVSVLSDHGVIASESTRAPIRLAFPARLSGRWLPGPFPDKVGEP